MGLGSGEWLLKNVRFLVGRTITFQNWLWRWLHNLWQVCDLSPALIPTSQNPQVVLSLPHLCTFSNAIPSPGLNTLPNSPSINVHSVTNSTNEYGMASNFVPDTVLGTADTAVNKTDKTPCPHGATQKRQIISNVYHRSHRKRWFGAGEKHKGRLGWERHKTDGRWKRMQF